MFERLTYWNEEYGCWSYKCASGDAAKRNGHRNGQTELLAYLLQIDTGCREAAERAMAEVGE